MNICNWLIGLHESEVIGVVRRVCKAIRKCVDDLLLVIGLVLFSIGVFKIYIPAGYIALGICFIAFAFFYAKKEVTYDAIEEFNR